MGPDWTFMFVLDYVELAYWEVIDSMEPHLLSHTGLLPHPTRISNLINPPIPLIAPKERGRTTSVCCQSRTKLTQRGFSSATSVSAVSSGLATAIVSCRFEYTQLLLVENKTRTLAHNTHRLYANLSSWSQEAYKPRPFNVFCLLVLLFGGGIVTLMFECSKYWGCR